MCINERYKPIHLPQKTHAYIQHELTSDFKGFICIYRSEIINPKSSKLITSKKKKEQIYTLQDSRHLWTNKKKKKKDQKTLRKNE